MRTALDTMLHYGGSLVTLNMHYLGDHFSTYEFFAVKFSSIEKSPFQNVLRNDVHEE